MAAAAAVTSTAASNRFAPLSSPKASPTTCRGNSRMRSDASRRSRSASPSTTRTPSQPTEYQGIFERLETYPSTWTHTALPSQQLATCGFSYKESEDDTCFCHVCGRAIRVRKLVNLEEWTNDDLLSVHTEDYVLADTIHDMIYNASYIYTASSSSRPQTPEALSPISSAPPCTSSHRELPSTEPAAVPPSPPISTERPTQTSTSSPRSSSPSHPSYAAVASRHCPTSSSSPSKPRRPSTTTPPAPTTKMPPSEARHPAPPTTATPFQHAPTLTVSHTGAAAMTPTATPTRRRSPPPSSSPVLSIYDLVRRFQNKPSPVHHHFCNTQNNTTNNALTQLLHAVADLVGSFASSNAFKHDHYLPLTR